MLKWVMNNFSENLILFYHIPKEPKIRGCGCARVRTKHTFRCENVIIAYCPYHQTNFAELILA